MRIQTRIFLVLSILVLAVVGVQVWLYQRQMKAVERSLGTVATSVGRDLLTQEIKLLELPNAAIGVTAECTDDSSKTANVTHQVKVETEGDEGGRPKVHRTETWSWTGDIGAKGENGAQGKVIVPKSGAGVIQKLEVRPDTIHTKDGDTEARVIRLQVDDKTKSPRMVVFGLGGSPTEIEIPTSPTLGVIHRTLRTSLIAAGGLFVLGLMASAVVSRRLARPLRDLVRRAEALGRGEFGSRVPVTASGEIGELEAAFDSMSVRLGQLETERENWRRREHLAQLGDLSRGLAHTVRNPLHTLGLAVEEMAGEGGDPRVETARSEIRRIDRWIRSFLALGAGDAAAKQRCDVVELVEESLLEAGGDGVEIRLEKPASEVVVEAVPTGIRSALANLIENAVQASDEGGVVEVAVGAEDGAARIAVRDHGPGIPESVRDQLFEPHKTTRPGGSGMGLFLARQLIEEMHGGQLHLTDAEGGGTLAEVVLPLAET